MGDLANLTDNIFIALTSGLASFLEFFPRMVLALLIFGLGWVFAGFCKRITLRLLKVLQFEPFAEKVGVSAALSSLGAVVSPPELIGELIKWFVVTIFLSPTVEVLGLVQVTTILNNILLYIPNVLVAVIILMLGAIFADLISQVVKGGAVALGASTSQVLSTITKYAIIVFSVLAALTQLGIATQLIQTLFTGLVAMLAIAGGLAFGLGGKDTAAEILESIKQSLKERR